MGGIAHVRMAEPEIPNLARLQPQRPGDVPGHIERGVRRNPGPQVAGPQLEGRPLTNQRSALVRVRFESSRSNGTSSKRGSP